MFEGNRGKRALNQNEPKPAVQTPECPVHLGDEAQAEWSRITPELRAYPKSIPVVFADYAAAR